MDQNSRPSVGEFDGYFNLNEADVRTVDQEDGQDVLRTNSLLPSFSETE